MSVIGRLGIESGICGDVDEQIAKALNLQVAWPNVKFEPPADGSSWLQVTVRTGESEIIETGLVRTFRTAGVLFVNVYGALGRGNAACMAIADVVLRRYRARTIAGVNFLGSNANDGDVENGWWVVKVQCPFYADEIE